MIRILRHKPVIGVAVVTLALVIVGLAVGSMWAWVTVRRIDLKRLSEPSVVYGASRILEPGLSVTNSDLAGILERLGYQEVTDEPSTPGQFRRRADAWEIFLRASTDLRSQRPALYVRLEIEDDRVQAVVNAADRMGLERVELEPEVLGHLSDLTHRVLRAVPLASVPQHVIAAVLAAEDRRFFNHVGVDPWSVGRAFLVNLRHARVVEGGSTITQQLAKSLDPGTRRAWTDKFRATLLALALEWRYSKAEILETYLNTVYLGQYGPLGMYGLGAAAVTYFQKDVHDLDLAEAATLAGMIRAPNRYSPVHNPYRTRERRNLVLRLMRDLGLITQKAFSGAIERLVAVQPVPPPSQHGPYFFDHVLLELGQVRAVGGAGAVSGAGVGGLRVYTSLDPVLQRTAEEVISRKLNQLERRFPGLRRPDSARRLQAALIALDAGTGEIRALVGGRDYWLSQFNRATHARRHPGSTFKPFVYLAALRAGPRGESPLLTAASLLSDDPITVTDGEESWTPRNRARFSLGEVTVRQALQHSLNVPAVRTAQDVGLNAIVRTAREVGFTSPLASRPALALGGLEVVPLELAAAYATLANGGIRVAPSSLRAVNDRGSETQLMPERTPSAIRAEEAYLVTHLLLGVMEAGTGAMAGVLGVNGPVAGKTGSTNRDAWLVGYTPRLVTLVWIGFDDWDNLRLSGARGALPIWVDFMRTAMTIVPSGPFLVPASVVFRHIDSTNGKLATPFCRIVVKEAFLPATVPTQVCSEHRPAVSEAPADSQPRPQ